MLSFFTPVSKIQKDRQVLRETDERMAKYSRRGLMANFVIFLLCMAVGDFAEKEPAIAIALTVGLLITTLLRAYLLFRFESLYPKAPTLWRMRYFYATLLGAAWWGIIIAAETVVIGIKGEGPLLWLYTIVFFSMTANAFAPYKQFLTIYQCLGIIPGALCLLFIGEMTGIIYGIVVLFFIWLLHHQCEQIADIYWERLESNALLARKTESLEEEKRDTRATAQLHRDYMLLLKKELQQLLEAKRKERSEDKDTSPESNDTNNPKTRPHTAPNSRPKLAELYSNVSDFYQILTKEIDFEVHRFSPHALLQYCTAAYADAAYQKNMDLELSLSPHLPHLIEGDAKRLNQIIESMIKAVIAQLEGGTLFIDVEYVRETGKVGEFNLLMTHQCGANQSIFSTASKATLVLNLELALAVGVAEAQHGILEISTDNKETQLKYRAKYQGSEEAQAPDEAITSFRNKRLLLIHDNPRILDAKRQELSLLGFDVTTESHFKQAFNTLHDSIKNNTPFAALIFNVCTDLKATAHFSLSLANDPDCKLIPQIIMGNAASFDANEMHEVLINPYVKTLLKPTSQQDFKRCFWSMCHSDEQVFSSQNKSALVGDNIPPALCDELTAADIAFDIFDDEKKLLAATEEMPYHCFVFINSADEFLTTYNTLHEKLPSSYIIAMDDQNNAHHHINQGVDIFLANQQQHSPLSLFIKTLQ
jgi:signal transduction histidine kinase